MREVYGMNIQVQCLRIEIKLTSWFSLFSDEEVQLEVFGVAELTMFSHSNGQPPQLNSPVLIEFPMDAYKDRFSAGDQIEAWYFDMDRGI